MSRTLRVCVGLILCAAAMLCGAAAHADTPRFVTPAGWSPQAQADGTVALKSADNAALMFVTPTQPAGPDFERQFLADFQTMEAGLKLGTGRLLDQRSGPTANGDMRARTVVYGTEPNVRTLMMLAQHSAQGVDHVVLYANDTGAMKRHMPAAFALFQSLSAAPGAVQAAALAPAGGSAQLQFNLPAGWGQAQQGANRVLTSPRTPSGKLNQLEVLPAIAMGRDAAAAFQAVWQQAVRGRFGTAFHPLPLRLRLPSGAAVLYDFDREQHALGGNDWVTPGLYLFTDGHNAVPVVASLRDFNTVQAELGTWLRSATLGTGQRAPELYRLADLAGTWRAGGSALASYVDVAGRYLGDASMASGETLTITAQGQCESKFAAVGGGLGRMRAANAGACRIEDDTLVLPSAQGPRRYRIGGVGTGTDAGRRFLLLSITRDDLPMPDASSQGQHAGDLYLSVP